MYVTLAEIGEIMNKCIKRILLLHLILGAFAHGACAPLIPGCWYVLPKIGIAPMIFTNRESTLWVEPLNGFENTRNYDASNITWPSNPTTGLNKVDEVIVDTGICLPKFSEAFSNSMLHFGGEIGYNISDNCLIFADLVYNRVGGNTVCFSVDMKNFGNPPANGSISTLRSNLAETYSAFHQFGAFLGARYYFDRMLCNRISFFVGNKIGIAHRRSICLDTLVEFENTNMSNENRTVELTNSDNTFGGGIHIGADICLCDWLSAYIGAEVVALCGLKMQRQIPIATNASTLNYIVQPSHIIPGRTGTLLQFPIWFGLRYDWGCC